MLTSDKSVGIELFCFIDFGEEYNTAAKELKNIYRESDFSNLKLMDFFEKFKSSKDRKKKLKSLIKAIAFELSSQGEVLKDEKLTTTLKELKRLLIFFSVDMQCLQLSQMLSKFQISVSSEYLLEDLIFILDHSWLTVDWMDERYTESLSDYTLPHKIIYVHNMRSLLKHIPEQLYRDEEQIQHIFEVYESLIDLYVENEDNP